MTLEERVKDIKHCGECGIYAMKNHRLPWYPDDGSFDSIINAMHIAQTANMLSKAYYDYINNCIAHGYSDGYIIGGIMQNEEQNKKFNVNIDCVIKSLIDIKYTKVTLNNCNINDDITDKEPVISKCEGCPAAETKPENKPSYKIKSVVDTLKEATNISGGGVKVDESIVDKLEKKINYLNTVSEKLKTAKPEEYSDIIKKIKSVCDNINKTIVSIDPVTCDEETISELNDITASVNEALKIVTDFEKFMSKPKDKSVKEQGFDKKESKQEKPVEKKPEEVKEQPEQKHTTDIKSEVKNVHLNQVEQNAAAHTEGGFNINNFIKTKNVNKGPVVASDGKPQMRTAFPHDVCGLTDDEINKEIGKHFKLIAGTAHHAYPLYDLINNKNLARKMKELNAKQTANNPFLTQVNINDYINDPELLNTYATCFTTPCNDKGKVIVVLFNPNPVQDKSGMLYYPMNVLKLDSK